jgi:NAD(P)-dependent dehydrogenase (short-subunit alcohol dehydrogenase family)
MALSGKKVVILGGTSGIGFAVAQLAVSEGASVIVASSSQAKVENAKARLGAGADGSIVDLTKEESIASFFSHIGKLDHLVYTAGESILAEPLASLSLERAKAFFGIRFWGAYAAAKYAAPCLLPGGSIVLTSGLASRRSRKGWTAVSSLCGATESLGRALAMELTPIRVNTVVPGTVKTEMWDALPQEAREAVFKRAEQVLPLARAGDPSEVALAYLFLMESGFTTGQTVVVDGGASVG